MGMHLAIIAVEGKLSELEEAFPNIWPKLKIASSKTDFDTVDAIWEWKTANEHFVSAAEWTKENPGSEVYILCQDGQWAVVMDFGYVLASDEKSLMELSKRFGTVISFIVESASGCAFFWCYESRELRRTIQNVDGEMTFSGTSLPQEKGINVENYYMDETEQLMKAFGLSRLEDIPAVSTTIAISTIDCTDYGENNNPNCDADEPISQDQRSEPWWKFW